MQSFKERKTLNSNPTLPRLKIDPMSHMVEGVGKYIRIGNLLTNKAKLCIGQHILSIYLSIYEAQTARTVKYADCISADG